MSHDESQVTSHTPEERDEDLALGRVIRSVTAEGLERQRGRAAAAFQQALEDPAFRMGRPTGDAAATGGHDREMRRLKLWAGLASVLAACLAVVVTLQFSMTPHGGSATPTDHGQLIATPLPVMDQVTFTRNLAGPTVVQDDGTPMRVVRQQTLRRTQWFDPAEHATYSVTEPVERVGYVRLRPD